MIDDPKNDDEQASDDDFELDVFEDDFDEDGFEDESWDNDPSGLDLNEDDASSASASPAPQQKTFLQKFFMPIVVVIVLIFGGLWYLAQGHKLLGSSSETGALPVEETAEIPLPLEEPDSVEELAGTDALPPMPSPIQTQPDTLSPLPEESQPLTPTPASDVQVDPSELPDLDAALNENADIRASEPVTDVQEEILQPLPDELPSVDVEMAEVVDSAVTPSEPLFDETPAAFSAQEQSFLSQPEEPPALLSDAVNSHNNAVLDLETVVEDIPESNTSETPPDDNMPETVQGSIALEPEPTIEDIAAQQDVSDQATLALETQKQELEQDINARQSELENLTLELSSLQDQIRAAQNELTSLQTQKEEAVQSNETIAAEVDAPIKAENTDTTAENNETAEQVQKRVQSKPVAQKPKKWVLRSAQPGKATIAQQGSNDLRTVEIGHTVQGVGQITSIQIENGKWVVRGTKSTVSQ